MKVILAYIFRGLLMILYAPLKLLVTDNDKIIFLSRQSNEPSIDFVLLKDELLKRNKDLKITMICSRVDKGLKSKLTFFLALLRSLYHLSTSKVCILDSYWPAVSMLKHKKSLKVIQLWHSIGKVKRSGYQTLDKTYGRSKALARVMRMHKNYDAIIAGGEAWNSYYCQSFGVTLDKLYNLGLPRIDYLLIKEEETRNKVLEAYPEFREKPMVLYAPTFRRNGELDCSDFLEHFNFDKFALVIKEHPNQRVVFKEEKRVYRCEDFTAKELLTACEYLITDYSAIAVEGAVLNKKTYYYLFDYEDYIASNGVNIDLQKEMPACVFKEPWDLIKALEEGQYDYEALKNYRRKYLPKDLGSSTKKIAVLVGKMIGEELNDKVSEKAIKESKTDINMVDENFISKKAF